MDAIGTGSAAVWERYLDEGVRYVDESGTVMTKKQMVDGTKPLPEGVSGAIKVIDFDAVVHGDVAVATYVDDENEDFHGHKLHCQYRTTDTWLQDREGVAADRFAGPRAADGSAGGCARGLPPRRVLRPVRADAGDRLRDPVQRRRARRAADRTEGRGAARRGAGRSLRARQAPLPVRVPPGRRREDHRLRPAPRGLGPRLETNASARNALIPPLQSSEDRRATIATALSFFRRFRRASTRACRVTRGSLPRSRRGTR